MKAQNCSDDRSILEFCSGEELSDFFYAQTGDPSPAGRTDIDADAWTQFVQGCITAIRHNSDPAVAEKITASAGPVHPATAAGF